MLGIRVENNNTMVFTHQTKYPVIGNTLLATQVHRLPMGINLRWLLTVKAKIVPVTSRAEQKAPECLQSLQQRLKNHLLRKILTNF